MARFITIVAIVVSLSLLGTLAGCIDHAPAYEATLLTYDEGLLGSWSLEVEDEKNNLKPAKLIPIEITPREDKVTHGRLGKFNTSSADTGKDTTVPAYRVAVTAVPDAPEKGEQTKVFTYNGVLLKIDGAMFLAYQPADDREVDGIFMDYLPVHRVVHLERLGDQVHLRFMKAQVVWVPTLRMLDEPSSDPKLPTEDGQYFVADADRLVKVLSLALKSPEAWEETLTVGRVR